MRVLWCGVLCGFFAGCPAAPPSLPTDAGPPARTLDCVGGCDLTVQAGDSVTLSAVLREVEPHDGLTPLAGQHVEWWLETLSQVDSSWSTSADTDDNGVASITLPTEPDDSSDYVIGAHVRALGNITNHARWTIHVAPIVETLRIVPGPPAVTLRDPSDFRSANVLARPGATVPLQLLVVHENYKHEMAPGARETVNINLVALISGTSIPAEAETAADGLVSIPLSVGTNPGSYSLIAWTPADRVTFNVTVSRAAPIPCQAQADCNVDETCDQGLCHFHPCDDVTNPCPFGFFCDSEAHCDEEEP